MRNGIRSPSLLAVGLLMASAMPLAQLNSKTSTWPVRMAFSQQAVRIPPPPLSAPTLRSPESQPPSNSTAPNLEVGPPFFPEPTDQPRPTPGELPTIDLREEIDPPPPSLPSPSSPSSQRETELELEFERLPSDTAVPIGADIVLPNSAATAAAQHTPRANGSHDAQQWLARYQARIQSDGSFETPFTEMSERPTLPDDFRPWWDTVVQKPLMSSYVPNSSGAKGGLDVDIASLSEGALRNSSYIQFIAKSPHVRHTELIQEQAAFDWRSFLNMTFNDINEPVGNTLTTGNNENRFKDQLLNVEGGARRLNSRGGEVKLFQQYNNQRNNSRFLLPNPQNRTRLELQYTQPLMQGAGRAYNESQIVLAQIKVGQSSDDVAEQLQAHLVKVTEAYWDLYRSRSTFLQRRRLLDAADAILANLSARRELDAVQRQVFRARTAVAKRKSELVRAAGEIRNVESRLRLLVNDPCLVEAGRQEYTPVDSPLLAYVDLDLSESLHTALLNRPDISRAIREVRAAGVELGVAQQDVLPRLDLVASSYIAGLASGGDTGNALGGQFSEGRPAYSLGFQFELPLGNRFANAEARRRQLKFGQAMNRFRLTVEESLTGVEIAVREVDTSYREMVAKYEAMTAAEQEALYLTDRWRVLPGTHDSASQLLENLLDAQERVADEEQALLQAQVDYALALVQLKNEMGTLLRVDDGWAGK